MKRRIGYALVLSVCLTAWVFAQQPASPAAARPAVARMLEALAAGDLPAAQAVADAVENPAARLNLQALVDRARGNPQAAIRKTAQAVALYHQDSQWLPRNELLCAQLYLELGMTNAADVTARQMQKFYEGTDRAKEADALRAKIGRATDKPE